jgi:triacylglycerol lipase
MGERIAIVLHHGLFGIPLRLGPLSISAFPQIDRALMGRGHRLIVSGVHPAASIATRARQLKEILLGQLKVMPGRKGRVLIISHSMGGLDARYMISRLGMGPHVAGLLTLSCPHHGSPYANWVVRHLHTLRAMQFARRLRVDIRALRDLTTRSCARFNERTPDDPGVKYLSISASRPRSQVPPWAMHSHQIVFDEEGANDSLVSVQSSRHGMHLGTWTADHWQMVNRSPPIHHSTRIRDITPRYVEALERILPELE